MLRDIRATANEVIGNLKEKGTELLTEAKNEGDEILGSARETSSHVAFNAAQENLQVDLQTSRLEERNWRRASIGSIAATLTSIIILYCLSENDSAQGILLYHSISRIGLILLCSGVSAIVVRIFRTRMHHCEILEHKLRLINLLETLYNAGFQEETRDKILLMLTEQIAMQPNTGLGSDKEDGSAPIGITIDSLLKTVSEIRK